MGGREEKIEEREKYNFSTIQRNSQDFIVGKLLNPKLVSTSY